MSKFTTTAIDPALDALRAWAMSDAGNMLLAYALGVAALSWAAAWMARNF